jgi:adenylate cyclase
MKTENLVILFTDIVGFTESTSLHSREQSKRILDRHNSILLPIVKRFRGRHIKSIGDALLLAFSSPTDGMRCAMAMQDAMHDYNLSAPPGEEIRIRIAASLGEVRVTRNDIFGEPVNVTSRIESITPQDEIYFSEAVYLAMNKAEVPALDVGIHELKGIPKPIRIFAIPRFVQTRLVPESATGIPGDPRLTYPFGGMHLTGDPNSTRAMPTGFMPNQVRLHPGMIGTIAAAVVLVIGSLAYQALSSEQLTSPPSAGSAALPAVNTVQQNQAFQAPAATGGVTTSQVSTAPQPPPSVQVGNQVQNGAIAPEPANPAAVVQAIPSPIGSVVAAPAKPTRAPKPKVVQENVYGNTTNAKINEPRKPAITTIVQAKQAYRAAQISKVEYRDIVEHLESEFDMYVRRTKLDYKEGRISKEQYRDRIESLKIKYIGER